MQVIRHPSFAEAEAKQRWMVAVSAVVWIGAWYWAGIHFKQVWLFIPIIGGLQALGPIVMSAFDFTTGAKGEQTPIDTLQSLPDDYTAIANWRPDDKSGDVDLVIVGPKCAIVIEVKTYSRPTRCQKDEWSVKLGNGRWKPISSPSQQLKRNVSAFGQQYNGQINGILVFNNKAELELTEPTVRILRRSEVLDFILESNRT